MSKNKFPKSVSFNLNNVNDQLILKHVKKRNFSGYVKRLILEDMAQKGKGIEAPVSQETTPSKLDRLRNELKSRTNNINNHADSSADT